MRTTAAAIISWAPTQAPKIQYSGRFTFSALPSASAKKIPAKKSSGSVCQPIHGPQAMNATASTPNVSSRTFWSSRSISSIRARS